MHEGSPCKNKENPRYILIPLLAVAAAVEEQQYGCRNLCDRPTTHPLVILIIIIHMNNKSSSSLYREIATILGEEAVLQDIPYDISNAHQLNSPTISSSTSPSSRITTAPLHPTCSCVDSGWWWCRLLKRGNRNLIILQRTAARVPFHSPVLQSIRPIEPPPLPSPSAHLHEESEFPVSIPDSRAFQAARQDRGGTGSLSTLHPPSCTFYSDSISPCSESSSTPVLCTAADTDNRGMN